MKMYKTYNRKKLVFIYVDKFSSGAIEMVAHIKLIKVSIVSMAMSKKETHKTFTHIPTKACTYQINKFKNISSFIY